MRILRPVYPTAPSPLQEVDGITASVDGVGLAPALDAPPDRPFAFVYSLTICNGSAAAITIKARKWVIKETATGRCHVIEGDGLTGQFPRVGPGEMFRCESFHVVAADSVAEGALLACDERGAGLLIRVPPFAMIIKG